MPSAPFSNPVAARISIFNFCTNRLKNWFEVGPSFSITPGIIEGPWRAPSSPPEIPAPTYKIPFSSNSLHLRFVSVKRLLPPSINNIAGA